MAETKPITKDDDKQAIGVDGRPLRTVEQTINEPPPAPTPTQEELDAMKTGEYTGEEEPPPPEGETQEQRRKREEDARKKREAKAASDAAGYQTRNA
jgi:hypothetical protein